MAALPALRCRISHLWVKLSNYGETLKHLVPSHIWKYMSGWTNHSEKVKSQMMIEREMGYRVTKSILYNIPTSQMYNVVKEQRVDGSWHGKYLPCLRYTLMDFEINYPIKVLSKQKRSYTNGSNKLNPWFVTGFADAESTFNVLIQPRSDSKTKWRVKAIFAIGLHKKDLAILEYMKLWFGVGNVYTSGTKVYYRVESFKDLVVIIDHFDKYPLVTAKCLDYALFKESFNIIKTGEHLTERGLCRLLNIKSILNKGLSDQLKENFANVITFKEKEIFKGIPNPYWVAGFVSGDGSFNIKTTQTRKGRVQLRFAVTLHIREEQIIKGFAEFFNFELNKNIYYTDKSVAIQIVNTSNILNVIIPFFDTYEIKGAKELDFIDFKKVSNIVKSPPGKKHLTEQGFNEILSIKSNMNLNRK